MVNDCQLGVLPSVQLFFAEARAAKNAAEVFVLFLSVSVFVCLFYCVMSHVNSYTHGGTVSYLTTLFPGQACVTFLYTYTTERYTIFTMYRYILIFRGFP